MLYNNNYLILFKSCIYNNFGVYKFNDIFIKILITFFGQNFSIAMGGFGLKKIQVKIISIGLKFEWDKSRNLKLKYLAQGKP